MKDIKDVLLYLDSFDENNMFDFEHNEKLLGDVLEVIRSEMNRAAIKYSSNYCEDAILNLFDLVAKIDDMISLKKPGRLNEVKKLYDDKSQYEYDFDTEDEPDEYDDYYELSEDSDTGEIIGFRNI